MQTKHLIFSLIAFVAILMTSCSEEQTGTGVNGTQAFTFNLTTDGQAQTRAGAPTVSGYKLKYFLQVLDANGDAITASSQESETGQFSVELPVGVAYTCLFWAHYITDAGAANEYFTVADLKAVTLQKHLTSGDECQAFCASVAIAASDKEVTKAVIMKRAVAQVNIKSDSKMEGYSKLTASYTRVANTFNVADNTVATSGSVTTPSAFEVTDFSASAGGDGKFIYQSAYFLASEDGTNSLLNIELKTYNNAAPTTPIQTMTIANVPTKKNFKTNVVTDFDPANTTHTYSCNFEGWGTDTDLILLSKWDGMIPTGHSGGSAFDGGAGNSESDPFIISSAASLAQLAADANAGCGYAGKYFKLTVDVDLNNKSWNPIGWEAVSSAYPSFNGHFNGMHHTISNLQISISYSSCAGLFGTVQGGSVTGLHVKGNVSSSFSGSMAGGLVGVISKATIRDCSFAGTVNGSTSGGLVGVASSNSDAVMSYIFASKSSGTVTGDVAGGIVGNAGGVKIEACYSNASLTGSGGNLE